MQFYGPLVYGICVIMSAGALTLYEIRYTSSLTDVPIEKPQLQRSAITAVKYDFVGNIRKVVFLILCENSRLFVFESKKYVETTFKDWEEESTFKGLSVIISIVNIIKYAEWFFISMSEVKSLILEN